MTSPADLSANYSNRDCLSYEVARLCRLENGTSYVENWEYDLWGAVMGLKSFKAVDFPQMNKLLFHARSSSVWVEHGPDGYYFVPMTSWLARVRDRKESEK